MPSGDGVGPTIGVFDLPSRPAYRTGCLRLVDVTPPPRSTFSGLRLITCASPDPAGSEQADARDGTRSGEHSPGAGRARRPPDQGAPPWPRRVPCLRGRLRPARRVGRTFPGRSDRHVSRLRADPQPRTGGRIRPGRAPVLARPRADITPQRRAHPKARRLASGALRPNRRTSCSDASSRTRGPHLVVGHVHDCADPGTDVLLLSTQPLGLEPEADDVCDDRPDRYSWPSRHRPRARQAPASFSFSVSPGSGTPSHPVAVAGTGHSRRSYVPRTTPESDPRSDPRGIPGHLTHSTRRESMQGSRGTGTEGAAYG
jgi:hypothetical protein